MSVIREIAVFLLGLLLVEALPTSTRAPAPPPKQLIQPSSNDPYDVNFFDRVTDQRQSGVGNTRVNVDGIMVGVVVPEDSINDASIVAQENLSAIAGYIDIQEIIEKYLEKHLTSSTTETIEELAHPTSEQDVKENTTTAEVESSSTQKPEESTLLMVENLSEKEQEQPKSDKKSGNKE